MKSVISKRNLTGFYSANRITEYFHCWSWPYIETVDSFMSESGHEWPWHQMARENCLIEHTWEMLGSFNARRASLIDKRSFEQPAWRAIGNLSKALSNHKLDCLRDLASRSKQDCVAIKQAIVDAVMTVSSLKPTKEPKPMFGSKVLHHYFPSVVPVFDEARVRNLIMRESWFVSAVGSDVPEWLVQQPSQGRFVDDYARWLEFVSAQTILAPSKPLKETRDELARLLMGRKRPNKTSIAYRLDAKLVEFCAQGVACHE